MEVIIATGAYLAMVGAGLALAIVTGPLFIRTLARLSGRSVSLNEMPKKRKLVAGRGSVISPPRERSLEGPQSVAAKPKSAETNEERLMKRIVALESRLAAEEQAVARRRQERDDVFFNKKEIPFSRGGGKVFFLGNTPNSPNTIYWRGNRPVVRNDLKL